MRRLVDEADGLTAEVLRSARQDGPSDAARRRAALALGLATATGAGLAEAAMGEGASGAGAASTGSAGVGGSGTGGATIGSATAGGTTAGVGGAVAGVATTTAGFATTTAAGVAATTSGLGTAALTSIGVAAASSGGWVVGLLAVIALSSAAGAAWVVVGSRDEARPRASDVRPGPGADDGLGSGAEMSPSDALAPKTPDAPREPAIEAARPAVTPPEAGPPTRRVSARRVTSPVPPAPIVAGPTRAPAFELAEEVLILDRAKTALAAAEPAAALELLDAYDRDAPAGALRPEAHALRIDAVLASGDRAAASVLARDFVARFPDHHLRLRYAELASEP